MTDINHQVRMERRDERRLVAPYRGGIAWRLLATFAAFSVAWIAILVAGFVGAIPLWLGGILSFVVATTFYMPMHEATHGNVWGDTRNCLLYTSPSPRDAHESRMPSSA